VWSSEAVDQSPSHLVRPDSGHIDSRFPAPTHRDVSVLRASNAVSRLVSCLRSSLSSPRNMASCYVSVLAQSHNCLCQSQLSVQNLPDVSSSSKLLTLKGCSTEQKIVIEIVIEIYVQQARLFQCNRFHYADFRD